MKTEKVKINKIKNNPNNPRLIKDDKFKKLVKSVKEFPEMLEIRPIVVDKDNIVLGGNMRLRACQEAGLKEVHIIQADQLTEKQQREFIIKDNVGFGEWDWDDIANNWDSDEIENWGFDVWLMPDETDYDLLNDEDLESELDSMRSEVKKAICIEFDLIDYDQAKDLVNFYKSKDQNVGKLLMAYLRDNKADYEA